MARRGRVRRTVMGRVAALAAALPLAGCATMFGGYDLAPNGLPRDEDAFRRALSFEAPKAYQSVIEGRRHVPEDPLLRLLYAGIAGRYAGAHEESSRLLDVASYLAEDRVTLSLSREALSLITSDRSLAYVPGPTERLMIPYLSALNFLEAGATEAAAVEARRIEALLDILYDGVPHHDRPADAAFLHYFAGAVFEAAGEWNAAEVAYRRAGRLAEATGPGDPELGDVVVLVERGFVPHRVEQSVIIVLPPPQVRMLTDGSTAERAVAAAEAAARILMTASLQYGDRSGYYRDHGYRSTVQLAPWPAEAVEDEDDDGPSTPYLLRISWPVLYQDPIPSAPVRVRAGELGADIVARLDVGGGVRRDFESQRTTMVARTVARSASKLAVSAAVEQSVAKRDEAAGQLAGLLTNIGTMLSERADTRGWHLLPGDVSMVRLRLPPGTHELNLETGRGDGPARTTPLATVTVNAGQTTFVSTRLWR